MPSAEDKDPMAEAEQALERLEEVTTGLRRSLDVKQISDATRNRARLIARVAQDAAKQIKLETSRVQDSAH